jgi:hypothetical protein
MNEELIISQLEKMSASEQWTWIISNGLKTDFIIELDNDATYVTFEDGYVSLKSDLGNREGATHLLEALGIKVRGV